MGKPYIIGAHGDRDTVIRLHRAWIMRRPGLLRRIPSLNGKVLGCYCAPAACHGDMLADLVEASRFVNLITGELHEEVV
jgi:hypothetical protein